MSVNLVLMTVMTQEWLTVSTSMAVSVVLVRLATLAREEMTHAKVTSIIDSVSSYHFKYSSCRR